MGTCVGDVAPSHAAKAMMRAIRDHVGAGTTLAEIRLIDFDESLRISFQKRAGRAPTRLKGLRLV